MSGGKLVALLFLAAALAGFSLAFVMKYQSTHRARPHGAVQPLR